MGHTAHRTHTWRGNIPHLPPCVSSTQTAAARVQVYVRKGKRRQRRSFQLRCAVHGAFRNHRHGQHSRRCHRHRSGRSGRDVLDVAGGVFRNGDQIRGRRAGGQIPQSLPRRARAGRTVLLYRARSWSQIQVAGGAVRGVRNVRGTVRNRHFHAGEFHIFGGERNNTLFHGIVSGRGIHRIHDSFRRDSDSYRGAGAHRRSKAHSQSFRNGRAFYGDNLYPVRAYSDIYQRNRPAGSVQADIRRRFQSQGCRGRSGGQHTGCNADGNCARHILQRSGAGFRAHSRGGGVHARAGKTGTCIHDGHVYRYAHRMHDDGTYHYHNGKLEHRTGRRGSYDNRVFAGSARFSG